MLHRALVCTMSALVTGALSASGPRTVTGMWQAAGLAGQAHWSRAHRFFSRAVWDLDAVGLALARAVVASLAPGGAAVTVAVDDTLFHRYGRKVHGAKYQHDGSAKGRDGIGRGNCFVIVGVVAAVPFLARQVCLPVLFRLHIPKTGASKTEQARAMVDLLAQALPGRTIHVVGDAPYRGPVWRGLPARVTFTTRLAANAVLHRPEPARTGRRGHPAWKGQRLGTAADMAATTTWTRTRVTRDGVTEDVDMAVVTCLWWGSLHRTPIRVVLVRDTSQARPYTLALATTDLATTGDAQSRLPTAVERTTPLGLANLTILVPWYDQAGQPTADLGSRRRAAPWYRHKRHVSIEDMLIAFRRARITQDTAAQDTPALFDETTPTSNPTAA